MASERSGVIRVYRARLVWQMVGGVWCLLMAVFLLYGLVVTISSASSAVSPGGKIFGASIFLVPTVVALGWGGLYLVRKSVRNGLGKKIDLDALDGELRSSSADTRGSAVSRLPALRPDEIMKRAVPLLTDPDLGVRAKVVCVLWDEKAGAALLYRVFVASDTKDDAVLRRSVLDGIVRAVRDNPGRDISQVFGGAANSTDSPTLRLQFLKEAIDAGLTWELAWTIEHGKPPRFPYRCCVCGKEEPDSAESVTISFRSGNVQYEGNAAIPICQACEKVVPASKDRRRFRIVSDARSFILWSPSAEFVAALMGVEGWVLRYPVPTKKTLK